MHQLKIAHDNGKLVAKCRCGWSFVVPYNLIIDYCLYCHLRDRYERHLRDRYEELQKRLDCSDVTDETNTDILPV